jgi:FkbM family methyltransferase
MIDSFEYFYGSAKPITTRVRGKIRQVVDFSTPRLHYVAGFADFPILCPSLTEPYMTTEQYLEFADLKEGDIALDLGSYSGLTTIAFSKAVGPAGKVIALEPDPLNFACVEENIDMHVRKNGLDNTIILRAAASSTSGKLRLSSEGAMGSALISIVGSYRGESVEVDCFSLSDIARMKDLPKIDFIKIDIEGAELDLITGSRAFIAQYRPRLIIEPHFIDGLSTSGPVISCLEELGYACSVIDQPGLSLPLITAAPNGRSRRG